MIRRTHNASAQPFSVSFAALVALVAASSALVAAACYGPDSNPHASVSDDPNARVVVGIDASYRANFDGVGKMLAHSCGTLDCHGQVGRNLRLYGFDGLRLDPADRTGGDNDTTAAELDADYRSVAGLEPEVMTAVLADGGSHPEWLTLYRKALGQEFHKGNAVFVSGDDHDRCFTAWLAGKSDTASCDHALRRP